MIIKVSEANSAKISAALLRARRTAGNPNQGMVLTLIIVCEEAEYADSLEASMKAGREHPARILLVVTGTGRAASMDAEVHLGEGTPSEVVVIRMRGPIAAHPASVIRPLLLPDSPVVIWWPGKVPGDRGADELSQLAKRRLTDASAAARPIVALKARAKDYRPGDTDLAWTRLTSWRALLAAALDQYPANIVSATVEAEKGNASADLLAAWLCSRLKIPVARKSTPGPGLTAVRLGTAAGDIAVTRADGRLASYVVPGQPERLVALKRREATELISEELRRMDADDIFEATLQTLASGLVDPSSRKRSTTSKGAKKTTQKRAPASS